MSKINALHDDKTTHITFIGRATSATTMSFLLHLFENCNKAVESTKMFKQLNTIYLFDNSLY
ncbi:hypothetical protein MAR_013355 [Mya arenaria]|uniref:Uncharacterized protein n=1 Tax=Mya arenaria TaxID=6604 RepID=A0ABY7G3P1_MYAAR|nr:hypothetical protein MAR_013355 [Mya arenaria]